MSENENPNLNSKLKNYISDCNV